MSQASRVLQLNMAAGQLHPHLEGRPDSELYSKGVAEMVNFRPTPTGAVQKIGGWEHFLSELTEADSMDNIVKVLMLGAWSCAIANETIIEYSATTTPQCKKTGELYSLLYYGGIVPNTDDVTNVIGSFYFVDTLAPPSFVGRYVISNIKRTADHGAPGVITMYGIHEKGGTEGSSDWYGREEITVTLTEGATGNIGTSTMVKQYFSVIDTTLSAFAKSGEIITGHEGVNIERWFPAEISESVVAEPIGDGENDDFLLYAPGSSAAIIARMTTDAIEALPISIKTGWESPKYEDDDVLENGVIESSKAITSSTVYSRYMDFDSARWFGSSKSIDENPVRVVAATSTPWVKTGSDPTIRLEFLHKRKVKHTWFGWEWRPTIQDLLPKYVEFSEYTNDEVSAGSVDIPYSALPSAGSVVDPQYYLQYYPPTVSVSDDGTNRYEYTPTAWRIKMSLVNPANTFSAGAFKIYLSTPFNSFGFTIPQTARFRYFMNRLHYIDCANGALRIAGSKLDSYCVDGQDAGTRLAARFDFTQFTEVQANSSAAVERIVTPADGFAFTAVADSDEELQSVSYDQKALVIFTNKGEWIIDADGGFINPTNIKIQRLSRFGTSGEVSATLGPYMLYLDDNMKLRELVYQNELQARIPKVLNDGFVRPDRSKVVRMLSSETPEPTCYVVQNDGRILAYVHDIGNAHDGCYEIQIPDISTIYDAFMGKDSSGVAFILFHGESDTLGQELIGKLELRSFDDLGDAIIGNAIRFEADTSGQIVVYDEMLSETWTMIGYDTNGKAWQVGNIEATTDGADTVIAGLGSAAPDTTAWDYFLAGVPVESKMKTMPIENGQIGQRSKISRVTCRLHESSAPYVGQSYTSMQRFKIDGDGFTMDENPAEFTGVSEVNITPNVQREARIYLKHTGPGKCTVTGIQAEVETLG